MFQSGVANVHRQEVKGSLRVAVLEQPTLEVNKHSTLPTH